VIAVGRTGEEFPKGFALARQAVVNIIDSSPAFIRSCGASHGGRIVAEGVYKLSGNPLIRRSRPGRQGRLRLVIFPNASSNVMQQLSNTVVLGNGCVQQPENTI
jgi:hypothetical protein